MNLLIQRCVIPQQFSLGATLIGCGETTKMIAGALPSLSLALLLAAGARVSLADATTLGDWLVENTVVSGLPALLDPIASAGRKAWNCKPELAASTPHVIEAGLPL